MILKNKKIWLIGASGMLGSSIKRLLKYKGYKLFITNKAEVNACEFKDINKYLKKNKPDVVINCAAKVGGILANKSFPAEFIFTNTLINLNIIHACYENNIPKLINFGSSCAYPKITKNIISENMLGTGFPEVTNQWYSFAKLNSLKMLEAYNIQYKTKYLSIIPTNLYGPGDNFDEKNSHVIPALINKIHKAKINNSNSITLWGSGKPLREFMYVDDAARGVLFIINKFNNEPLINLGTSNEISIKKLSSKIAKIINYEGSILFDTSKPDGAKRKLLNSNKIINKGWKTNIGLDLGIKKTYNWYLKNISL